MSLIDILFDYFWNRLTKNHFNDSKSVKKTFSLRSVTGSSAEERVSEYFLNQGYRLVSRNIFNKVGEIDLIFSKKNKYYFVEVRSSKSKDKLDLAIGFKGNKFLKFRRATLFYIKEHDIDLFRSSMLFVTVTSEGIFVTEEFPFVKDSYHSF